MICFLLTAQSMPTLIYSHTLSASPHQRQARTTPRAAATLPVSPDADAIEAFEPRYLAADRVQFAPTAHDVPMALSDATLTQPNLDSERKETVPGPAQNDTADQSVSQLSQ